MLGVKLAEDDFSGIDYSTDEVAVVSVFGIRESSEQVSSIDFMRDHMVSGVLQRLRN